MKFTIYTADCTGNPQNKMYPHETVITSAADMKKSARFDHVCARYTSNSRSEANFLSSDNVPMDCDNSHSEKPTGLTNSILTTTAASLNAMNFPGQQT